MSIVALDLEDNALGAEGAVYISEMLRENSFITSLVSCILVYYFVI